MLLHMDYRTEFHQGRRNFILEIKMAFGVYSEYIQDAYIRSIFETLDKLFFMLVTKPEIH